MESLTSYFKGYGSKIEESIHAGTSLPQPPLGSLIGEKGQNILGLILG
jgi:ribosomal protein L11